MSRYDIDHLRLAATSTGSHAITSAKRPEHTMLRFMCILGLMAVVAATAAALVRAGDDDDKVPLDKLPKEVTETLKKKFPGAELVSATTDADEKDKPTYEVTIKFKKHQIDVTLTPAGTILQVEREIEVKEVPKVVT